MKNMTRTLGARASSVAALLVLSLSMSACAPLLIGGAATTAVVANDRRSSGAFLEDASIELKVNQKIEAAMKGRAHLSVTSFNRRVLLTGEVATPALKALAQELAKGVPNVALVVNELVVAGNASTTQRAADALLLSRVKIALIAAQNIDASIAKVVADRGQIYLMGLMTAREADAVTEVVRRVSGVQGVVRVIEVISEQQLKQYEKAAAKNAGSAAK